MNKKLSMFLRCIFNIRRTPVPRLVSTVLFCCVFLSACVTHRSPVTALSTTLSLSSFGKVSAGPLMAWAPDGKTLAVNDNGLVLIDLAGGKSRQLNNSLSLSAIVWSPGGEYIAYAVPGNGGSMLRIVDLKGELRSEVRIDGTCRQLYWPHSDKILAGFTRIQKYRFGTSFQSGYVEWDAVHSVKEVKLVDTTLKPTTPSSEEVAHRLFSFDLSPWGDEIIYSALNDPPLFATYSQLKFRHLQSGNEWDIVKQPLSVAGGLFCNDGQGVFYPGGDGHVFTKLLWNEGSDVSYDATGARIVTSESGPWRVVDSVLYEGTVPRSQLSMSSKVMFSPTGRRIAVIDNNYLYVIDGLFAPQRVKHSEEIESKIRMLRDLRGKQLITPAEYLQRVSELR